MKSIAVTGGPSTGKTSVCRLLGELGALVIHADDIVHSLLETSLKDQVVALLGSEILTAGHIDRAKVAKIIFNDRSQTRVKALENLIHPAVKHEIQQRYQQAADVPESPLFVVEVPLLFEAGWETDFDTIVLVDAPLETCMNRSPLSMEEFNKRASRFIPVAEKRDRCQYQIINDGSKESLKQSVKTLYQQLINP